MSNSKGIKRIKALHKQIWALEIEYTNQVKKAFPIGSEVYVRKGRGSVYAEVIMVSYGGDQLRVKNHSTGKEYWVGLHFIIDFFQEAR